MTINAARKIISLSGPNCSFGNISACRVDVVGGVASSLQFMPTYLIDAESATLGATYVGSAPDKWSDGAAQTIAQNDYVLYGAKAWRMKALATVDNTFQFGGWKTIANTYKGSSVHCQWSVYFPTAFNWYAGGGGRLKFFRIHTATAAGANAGYNDVYINTLGLSPNADGKLAHIYEGAVSSSWTEPNPTETLTRDTWETFEMRVDLDNVAMSSGGGGRTRVWRKKSGVMSLILDVQDQRTLTESGGYADKVLMFTYWNGEPTYPASDQTCYADRIIIENDVSKLVETDANGYKIIGGL